ncbi:MAG: tyrosine--tRNA ligase [Planctomycetota bacterium]|nr:MAG: tyrosine--tRNA ligase [Planctomycetota bacterium]
MSSVYETLQGRGLVEQVSDEGLGERLGKKSATMYVGFDPTAESLQLGNLVPIMAMAHFQRAGHKVLAVVGGATGMIGDPSGKNEERNLLTAEKVAANAEAMKQQLSRFLDFTGPNAAVMLDNNDWIGPMGFTEWLRDVGKFFTVNYMVAKESVKTRMASANGISFTEFSYMTLQAYDFLHLFDTMGCTVQYGGNDQWGNITAGIDLVRKRRRQSVYGLTCPLVKTSNGEKFGKSAGNALWLDPARTSPYHLYQYWVGQADADVEKYLKIFTFLPLEQIAEVVAAHNQNPERREGQKLLAAEVTRVIHGQGGLDKALAATDAMFGGDLAGLTDADLADIFDAVPSSELPVQAIAAGAPLVDVLAGTDLANSKGQARKLIAQGGISVNNIRATDTEAEVNTDTLAGRRTLILRAGKKRYHLVKIV